MNSGVRPALTVLLAAVIGAGGICLNINNLLSHGSVCKRKGAYTQQGGKKENRSSVLFRHTNGGYGIYRMGLYQYYFHSSVYFKQL